MITEAELEKISKGALEKAGLPALLAKVKHLRESHAELLAAAKRALRVLQKLQPHVHMDAAEALQAAIAKAEELGE